MFNNLTLKQKFLCALVAAGRTRPRIAANSGPGAGKPLDRERARRMPCDLDADRRSVPGRWRCARGSAQACDVQGPRAP